MRQDEALIDQLCARFEGKPRKCSKINDSNIGSGERIVCIDKGTFYYYPKIQQFQDLDFGKLQYVVPKAGVMLEQITQLRFPPRRQNQRNFFSITLPKNKILKFTKTLVASPVDPQAEGEQEWTFYFDYDIVALPIRERKLREAQLKEQQNARKRNLEGIKLKQAKQREKIQKIKEQINSLNQAQQLRSGAGENEEYMRKKQLISEQEQIKRRINETDELFFHYHYRKLLNVMPEKMRAETELLVLEQIGKFRERAEETVRQFVDEMSFSPIKLKYGIYYHKNNLKLKFGEKGLNQQFIANSFIANAMYELKRKRGSRGPDNKELRVPLKAMVKYKGFKVLVCAMTPLDRLEGTQYDQAITHGSSSDNWKIDFVLVEILTDILDCMHLKPYFSEVHYQKVQIHLGSSLKVLKTDIDPYADIKALDQNAFPEVGNYSIHYFYQIDEVFPIDLDFNRSVNQQNVRLRPQYIKKFVQLQKNVTHLSAGSLAYALDDQEGQKEDINVARASQILKLQQIVKFVKKLDELDIVVANSQELSSAMKKNGINMRYLGRIIKLTSLPYVRVMAEIEGIARVVRSIYRQHQKQFAIDDFRSREDLAPLIEEAFNPKVNISMRKIRIKQLKQQQDHRSRLNAADFLNLMFGSNSEFQAFWGIIRTKVRQLYEFQMKLPEDYPHGYLLKTTLYHCGIQLKLTDHMKLFISEHPFQVDDILSFPIRSKVFDFPSMGIYKLLNLTGIEEQERIVARLELGLQIKRALKQTQIYELLQLSRYCAKVGPPSDKYSLQSFYYYLYHATSDNFQLAYSIAQVIFPSSHPAIMELYLEYAKIKDLDPVVLKKAAENHAIRNLGISHWKTSIILSNFKQSQYVDHLIRAEPGVEKGKQTHLYLQIVRELTKFGKLEQSLIYVNRAIVAVSNKTHLGEQQLENYFEIMTTGLQNYYLMRAIEDLLKLSEHLYGALTENKIPETSKWYEFLLYYSFKGFLESSKRKYYLFKLILIFSGENDGQPVPEAKRKELMIEMGKKWKSSRNHINHLKEMLIKLEFGFTEINYLPDFFGEFRNHVGLLKNEDFNEALEEFRDFYLIFGFKYFQEALLENIFAFERHRIGIRENQHQQ